MSPPMDRMSYFKVKEKLGEVRRRCIYMTVYLHVCVCLSVRVCVCVFVCPPIFLLMSCFVAHCRDPMVSYSESSTNVRHHEFFYMETVEGCVVRLMGCDSKCK
jgi:hypothetical protein